MSLVGAQSIPSRLSAIPVLKYLLIGIAAEHELVWYDPSDWSLSGTRLALIISFYEYPIAHEIGVASGDVPSGKNTLKATPVILKYWYRFMFVKSF